MVVLNHIYTGILHTVVVLNHIYTGILHTVIVFQLCWSSLILITRYLIDPPNSSIGVTLITLPLDSQTLIQLPLHETFGISSPMLCHVTTFLLQILLYTLLLPLSILGLLVYQLTSITHISRAHISWNSIFFICWFYYSYSGLCRHSDTLTCWMQTEQDYYTEQSPPYT